MKKVKIDVIFQASSFLISWKILNTSQKESFSSSLLQYLVT